MSALQIILAATAIAFVAVLAWCEDVRVREAPSVDGAVDSATPEPVAAPAPKKRNTLDLFREHLNGLRLTTGSFPSEVEISRLAVERMARDAYPGMHWRWQPLTVEEYTKKTVKAAEAGQLRVFGVRIKIDSAVPGRECGEPSLQEAISRQSVIGLARGAGTEGGSHACGATSPARANREGVGHG